SAQGGGAGTAGHPDLRTSGADLLHGPRPEVEEPQAREAVSVVVGSLRLPNAGAAARQRHHDRRLLEGARTALEPSSSDRVPRTRPDRERAELGDREPIP